MSSPEVVIFGSARPVTCAVMDYARRLGDAVNAERPGSLRIETIEPQRAVRLCGAIVRALQTARRFTCNCRSRAGATASSRRRSVRRAAADAQGPHRDHAARMDLAQRLRYLSMIPDLVASDGFVFVSPRQRDAFLATPWVPRRRKPPRR